MAPHLEITTKVLTTAVLARINVCQKGITLIAFITFLSLLFFLELSKFSIDVYRGTRILETLFFFISEGVTTQLCLLVIPLLKYHVLSSKDKGAPLTSEVTPAFLGSQPPVLKCSLLQFHCSAWVSVIF